MDGECLSVTVVDRVEKLDTLGGYVFLVFLLCLLVGFILGLLLARCILRELEVRYTISTSKITASSIFQNTYKC